MHSLLSNCAIHRQKVGCDCKGYLFPPSLCKYRLQGADDARAFGQGGRRMDDRLLPDGWVVMPSLGLPVPENRHLSAASSSGQRQEQLQGQLQGQERPQVAENGEEDLDVGQ